MATAYRNLETVFEYLRHIQVRQLARLDRFADLFTISCCSCHNEELTLKALLCCHPQAHSASLNMHYPVTEH
jgi:hypothetical protein